MLFVPRPHHGRLEQTANGMFYMIWRRKSMLIVTSLFIVGAFIIMSKAGVDDMDYKLMYTEALIAEFDDNEKSNLNSENTSMFHPQLLEETRQKWITFKHNDSMPYNLDEPNVIEQSMGQAAIIRELFKNMTNGFFIECGAYDGETRSNTLFLERYLNWTGLLIEANPILFRKLVNKNRRANLSNTCLSTEKYPKRGVFLLADNIGRLHTPHDYFEFDWVKNTADIAHHGPHIEIQCLPLATYVAALKVKTVDYFSLDIEGLEPEVLLTIPFDLIDIKTLSVEFTHNKESLDYLTTIMDVRGYDVAGIVKHKFNLANDLIFVKREFKDSLT